MATTEASDSVSQVEPTHGAVESYSDAWAPFDQQTAADAALLSGELSILRQRLGAFPNNRTPRSFSSGEAAGLIGVSDGYLRQLSLSGEGPQPSHISQTRRRAYSLEDVNALRVHLAAQGGPKAKQYVPHRNPSDGEQLQILTVANLKSGSGKTTTATHLAQYMALQGYRVLAIDLDPQAAMSGLLGSQPELASHPNTSIYDAVRYDAERVPLNSVIVETCFAGLHLSPGSLKLQEFDHLTPLNLAMGSQENSRFEEELFFTRVRAAIISVAHNYDIAILDCPPHLGFLTLSALCAATSVILPVHPSMLDLSAMSEFLSMVTDLLSIVRERGGEPASSYLRYLVTDYEPNDGPQTQIVAFLRAQFGERVLTAPMVKSTAISDAALINRTLYETGRQTLSRAIYDRAMESLTSVNSEIEDLVKANWGRSVR